MSTVKRLPLLSAVFVALAVLASACGSAQATAVTVNGSEISRKSVDEEMIQIRDNKKYRQAINLPDLEGTGKKDTFKAEFAAQVVTLRIYYALVHQELGKRDVKVAEADLKAARAEVENQVGTDPRTGQPAKGLGKKVIDGFSADYQEMLILRQAEVAKLQEVLAKVDTSDKAIRKYYDEHQAEFAEVCTKHVLLDTKEAADKVVADLRGGGDLAVIAEAQSKDPSAKQNKGDLGCSSPASYVEAFAKSTASQPVGAIGEPVQTNFGWHVIQVYKRTQKSFAEVKDQIREQLSTPSGDALNSWLVAALKKAKIEIDKRFGTFDRTPGQGQLPRVVPPEAPATTARKK